MSTMEGRRQPHRVTLIPGDGVGPELMRQAVRVLEATGVRFDWDVQDAGEEVMRREGSPLPERVLESLRRNGVGYKGPITTPVGKGFRSVNVTLRQELDLFACVRPIRTFPGVRSPFPYLDVVVVRENTEDLYLGNEFLMDSDAAGEIRRIALEAGHPEIRSDSAIALKPISRGGSHRIVQFAFEYAERRNRTRVTAVHKANIMKATDGLFLEVAGEVAREYPQIRFDDAIIDALCMQLVQHPGDFQILVLPNLYGDIVSDLVAGLAGGLGIAPGANVGDRIAMFEPTHGSAPQFAGQNRLNPTAAILSGALLLHHLGHPEEADRVESAVAHVLGEGKAVTFDVKGDIDDPTAVGTAEMADAIIEALEASSPQTTPTRK